MTQLWFLRAGLGRRRDIRETKPPTTRSRPIPSRPLYYNKNDRRCKRETDVLTLASLSEAFGDVHSVLGGSYSVEEENMWCEGVVIAAARQRRAPKYDFTHQG
ncbi:uncharacterized [Tachysurus ichikawai]